MRNYLTIIFICVMHISSYAQTDAKVEAIYTLGQIPAPLGTPNHIVQARVSNNGSTVLNNLAVTLNVTGANVFSNSKTITVGIGDTLLVSFDPFSPNNLGTNTVTVTVPADDNNGNNSAAYTQIVNNNTFSYADASPVSLSYGFGTSSGIFLTKYSMKGSGKVTKVKAFISTAADTNFIYAVVLNSAGQIVGQSGGLLTDPANLDTYVDFIIITPPVFTDVDFYVGIAQTANSTEAYSPMGAQAENPVRSSAYYLSSVNGPPFESILPVRWMIQAEVATVLQNDASVANTNILSQTPLAFGNPDSIKARITNTGVNNLTDLPVNLDISGTNPFTDSKLISLASQESKIVSFAPHINLSNGINNVTVSIPGDDNNTNNIISRIQTINNNTYSFADGAPIAGYDTTGFRRKLLVKYRINGFGKVSQVRVNLNGVVGNSVYAVVINETGSIVGKSNDYVIQPGDIGNYKTFDITLPPPFYNSYVFVGLARTENIGGFPTASYQVEPGQTLPGIYYEVYSDGSANLPLEEIVSNKRYMIQAVISAFTPPTDDVIVEATYTLGKIPIPIGTYNHVVKAKITNLGATPKTNLLITLGITGANSFTNTKTINLAPLETLLVDFDPFSSWNLGNNTVTVSIPPDGNNSNNAISYNQIVNDNAFSYADTSTPTGARGFGTGEGMLLNRYSVTHDAFVKSVKVHISNDTANIGHIVHGVLEYDTITFSPPHVISAGDLNTFITLDFLDSVQIFSRNSRNFYIGILQTTDLVRSYTPVSFQDEGIPTRFDAYYSNSIDGNNLIPLTDSGRLMIEAIVSKSNTGGYNVIYEPSPILAAWDFTGSNSPASLLATIADSSLSFTPELTRGPGAPPSSAVNSFSTRGFGNDSISVGNDAYFEVSLSPKTGDTLSITDIGWRTHGKYFVDSVFFKDDIAYSIDGQNFTLIDNLDSLHQITAPTIVTLRYYATGMQDTGDIGFISYSPGLYGLTIYGTVVSSNTIRTDFVVPTGADFTLPDCNTGAPGSIGFTSTGNFGVNNKYLVQIGEMRNPFSGPFYEFYRPVTIDSLVSNANSGVINFTIPPKTSSVNNVLRIVSTDPYVEGSFSRIFNINAPYCVTASRYGYFRTIASGDWNNLSIWESSPSSIGPWIAATSIPNVNAWHVDITQGHLVAITSNVSATELFVAGTLQIINDGINTGSLFVEQAHHRGKFMYIDTTGIFQVISSFAVYEDVILNQYADIHIAGRIIIGNGVLPCAVGFDKFAGGGSNYNIWYNGSVFEWNSPAGIGPRTEKTYFPGNPAPEPGDPSNGVVTFRLTKIPVPTLGGDSSTLINGLLEVNTPVTWIGSGTKTFRDGLQGSSTVTQAPTSGKFITNSSFAELPPTDTTIAAQKGVINGTIDINLNDSTGYMLLGGAAIPDTADVRISGQATSLEKIEVQQGGKMTIDPASVLDIHDADLVNMGTLTGAGIVKFTGDSTSVLNSPGVITAPILLEGKRLRLAGHTNTASIDLTNISKLQLDSFNLNMGSALLTGDSANFIITNDTGRLNRYVAASSTVSYYIGVNDTSYAPVIITNSGTADNIKVRVEQGVQTGVVPTTGNVNHTWRIGDTTQTGLSLSVTLGWNASDEQDGFDRSNCYVSRRKVCPPPINCSVGFYDAGPVGQATGGPITFSRERSGIDSFNTNQFIVTSTPFMYRFTGSGNWADPLNWTPGLVPPTVIAPGTEIVIDGVGVCNYNGSITVQQGGKLTVEPGKILNVSGSIIVE